MKTVNKFLLYWFPAIVWMAFIFYLSSRLSAQVTGTFIYDFIIFKALHMIEYAVLYFLLFRGFYSLQNKKMTLDQRLIWPILISLFYAISDEFHQTLVPTREGKIRDVIIDSVGVLLMYIYIKNNLQFLKRFL